MENISIQTICCIHSALCHHSSSPSLHLSALQDWREYHHHRQPCPGLGRDTAASVTVRPPSFHAPPVLMCAHVGRLCETTQTPSWWDLPCSLSRVLTPQTLRPFPSSRNVNVVIVFKLLVNVDTVSLKRRLIAIIAVECCCKFISQVKVKPSNLTTCQSLENDFCSSYH